MTLEDANNILDISLMLVAMGFFIHGWFWNNTHSLVITAVFLLIAQ